MLRATVDVVAAGRGRGLVSGLSEVGGCVVVQLTPPVTKVDPSRSDTFIGSSNVSPQKSGTGLGYDRDSATGIGNLLRRRRVMGRACCKANGRRQQG